MSPLRSWGEGAGHMLFLWNAKELIGAEGPGEGPNWVLQYVWPTFALCTLPGQVGKRQAGAWSRKNSPRCQFD